ncbi:MAG: glycosyltransferase [Brevinematales bacterium]|jgi:glycosyltransferase involved in cell wall biosynthesis
MYLVSVIITTKNEEKNIEACLKSIKGQTYKDIEIIVVDNLSSDSTKEIALKFTGKVFDKGPERSAQRNFGMIDKSSGEYVMYIDADMLLSPDLIEACVEEMKKDNSVSALHIPEIVLGKSYFSRVRRFERCFYNGTCIDGARFFLKSAFVSAGGFDESMSGPEDWDMDKKIKTAGKIQLLEVDSKSRADAGLKVRELYGFIRDRGVDPSRYGAVIFHNESEFDLSRYLTKKGYYSQSFATYIKKWGKNDPDIIKQFGVLYRFFCVFTEKGKWKRLAAHPVLTFGLYFLRFVVGFTFLMKKPVPK